MEDCESRLRAFNLQTMGYGISLKRVLLLNAVAVIAVVSCVDVSIGVVKMQPLKKVSFEIKINIS